MFININQSLYRSAHDKLIPRFVLDFETLLCFCAGLGLPAEEKDPSAQLKLA
jgi:hypothetical protein